QLEGREPVRERPVFGWPRRRPRLDSRQPRVVDLWSGSGDLRGGRSPAEEDDEHDDQERDRAEGRESVQQPGTLLLGPDRRDPLRLAVASLRGLDGPRRRRSARFLRQGRWMVARVAGGRYPSVAFSRPIFDTPCSRPRRRTWDSGTG